MRDLAYIFIRNDDVWEITDSFSRFVDIWHSFNIPIVHGVIPARLKPSMIRHLVAQKKRHPEACDIVQHGYQHVNYSRGMEAKYEFGRSRSYQEQRNDIAQGLKLMEKAFGIFVTPGFIPPYHGYDHNTLRALNSLKVPLFSAGDRLRPQKGLIDLPARVSMGAYRDDGTSGLHSFDEMYRRVVKNLVIGRVTGLLFHHEMIKSSRDWRSLIALASILAKLREDGRVRIMLFSNLLKSFSRVRRTLSRPE